MEVVHKTKMLERQSVCLSVCPSVLRFRALTLVPFDLFSSNLA